MMRSLLILALVVLATGATRAHAQACQPRRLGAVRAPAGAQAHAPTVQDGVAYVAAHEAGLVAYDVADPASPVQLGPAGATTDAAMDVVVRDGLAYVADRLAGLGVVDVADPGAPRLIASLDLPGVASAADAEGSTLVIAAEPFAGVQPGGVHVFDLSVPEAPVALSTITAVGVPLGVDLVGDRLYIADGFKGLLIYDVADPGAPVRLAQINPYAGQSAARDVRVEGDHAYLAYHTAGFQVFDVAEPTAPELVASLDTPGDAWSVSVHDGRALLTDRVYVEDQTTLLVIDVADPAGPVVLGSLALADAATGHALVGSVAYLTTANADPPSGRLDTIDVGSCLPCPADFNADGALNVLDFVDFQLAFLDADPEADCDGDAELTASDFLCFQQRFGAGCP